MGKSGNSGNDIAVGALDQVVAGNFQGPHQCLDALVRFLDGEADAEEGFGIRAE